MSSLEPENRSSFTNNSDEDNWSLYDNNYELLQIIELVCCVLILLPSCVIGIPTNIINCLVFWRQGIGERMNLCLFSLALVDFLYLTIVFTGYPISSLIRFHDKQLGDRYLVESLSTLMSVLYGLRATSGFVGVVIAVERCLCIVFPLRSSIFIQTKNMGKMIITSFFVFQLSYLPYSLLFKVTLMAGKTGQRWQLTPSQFYLDNKIVLEEVVGKLLDLVIPGIFFLILVVMTTVTVVKLKAAMKWRQTATRVTRAGHDQQAALTVMLLVVSVVYIATMMPYVVCNIVNNFLPDPYGASYVTFSFFNNVSHHLTPTNSAFHIFIYYSRSSRFRETLRNMFGYDQDKRIHNQSPVKYE